jgi:hypothetical protein
MAGDDLLAGQAYVEGLTNSNRKTAAYNALSAVYGPIAGDPEAALKLQQYDFNTKQNPLLLEKDALDNSHQGQVNAFDRANNPLLLQEKTLANQKAADTNAVDAATAPARIEDANLKPEETRANIAGKGLENTGQGLANTTAQHALDLSDAAGVRDATSGILAALVPVVNAGGDIAGTFDKLAPTIVSMHPGMTPEQLATLRAQMIANPVETINNLQQAIQAAAVSGNPALAAKAAAANTPEARAAKIAAMQFIQARVSDVPRTAAEASELVDHFSSIAIVRKANALYPGKPEYTFMLLQHKLAGNLSLDDLRSLRATGFTLGRTNVVEFTASAAAVANLDPGQDPAMLKASLARVGTIYKQASANMAVDIDTVKHMGLGGGAATGPRAAQPGGISENSVASFLSVAVPGARITSGGRTDEQNRRDKGVPGSLHTTRNADGTLGQAVDFVPPGPKWTQKELDSFRATLDAKHIPHTELTIDFDKGSHSTGYHIHWGWGTKAPRGAAPARAAAPASDTALKQKYGL